MRGAPATPRPPARPGPGAGTRAAGTTPRPLRVPPQAVPEPLAASLRPTPQYRRGAHRWLRTLVTVPGPAGAAPGRTAWAEASRARERVRAL